MESQKDTQKDTQKDIISSNGQEGNKGHAIKIEKLVTAIHMVTDFIDKEEPVRNKLRGAGLELLSDTSGKVSAKISEIMSLISISTSIGLISDMNGSILNKELTNLKNLIDGKYSSSIDSLFIQLPSRTSNHSVPERVGNLASKSYSSNGGNNVLYKTPNLSLNRGQVSPRSVSPASAESKNARRENILNIIKEKNKAHPDLGGVTIKDISSNISDCSEKTIQRELISLLKDKVIKKTGEKRWSKYYL